ncbi:hypothetical protein GPECTOR_32g450 [Gonium pectorale]|uniref:Uncharacterized protein n=1 Tax=Gonium pectorale TaxID=33097 RepID=A0A150GDE8_GONPE|nr:hypothetical protein GPECTOR_32g450 [Gonium pectorale]|eukprot:KXZ47838.1 hypothetical protein GPECTOR_32g450 [Gonium pectorale]
MQKHLARVRALQHRFQVQRDNLRQNFDSYDEAATEVMPALACLLEHIDPKIKKDVEDCMNKLDNMRSSHYDSHRCMESLIDILGTVIAAFVDIKATEFAQMQEALRRTAVLGGCRDHVDDFRWWVFQDLVSLDPDIKQQYGTVDVFFYALTNEFKEYKAGLIKERPLNVKWYQSVGLEPQQWVKIRALNSDTISAFHRKLTLKELETEVFPPDLELCRPVLLKAAKKVQELEQSAKSAAPTEGEPDEVEPA